ncbi:MAG: adenylate/guanylate cyclase domain-containing protein [Gammaproteobacteria bacterium]|nr:adenylate/guanylate cyclase domain-containing protein [Gammaproteobacteria bacterium]
MTDRLFEHYGARLVAFDVVFAEPDESSGLKILEELAAEALADVGAYREQVAELRQQLDYDQRFADSLSGRDVILGYYFRLTKGEDGSGRSGMLPPPVLTARDFRPGTANALLANGYGANLAMFQQAASGGGHFNPEIDSDGVVRRVPMLFEFEGGYYESLSLAVVRHLLGGVSVEPGYVEPGPIGYHDYSGLEWLQAGSRHIPIDDRMRALVPYRGRFGSFPYVSAADILSGEAPAEIFEGRIVLVGTSAPGLFDLRSTPVQSEYPGVEIHANLIAGILDNNILERPAYTLGAEFVHVLFAGIVMLLLPLLSPLLATAGFVVLAAVSVLLNLWVWTAGGLVLPIASVLSLVLVMFILNMTWGFFFEQRNKRQLSSLFGQYIPPELVDEMSENPQTYSLEAENREMTVLFSDVRGFTSISESMDPGQLSELMNELLTPLTRVIHGYRGTIDKYMGDAIMAFWGAPLRDDEHARHAVEAGLDMIRRLDELQPAFQARGWPTVRIGVGINTGDMNVGNMGSEFRRAYTVLGDAVNLGARLEALTRVYGVDMLVSEFTRAVLPDHAFREIDRVRVKGRDEPVVIYEPLGPKDDFDKALHDELRLYQEGLRHYRAQEWDLAEMQFLNLRRQSDRTIYGIYIERIQHFRANPPGADWDGVFTHTSK